MRVRVVPGLGADGRAPVCLIVVVIVIAALSVFVAVNLLLSLRVTALHFLPMVVVFFLGGSTENEY